MEYLCKTCAGCNRLLLKDFVGTRNCKNYINMVKINEEWNKIIKAELEDKQNAR